MFQGSSSAWSAVCHVWVELEGSIIRLISPRKRDTWGSCGAAADDIEIEAVKVNLDLTLQSSLFEFSHITMQGNKLSSQHIVAWFDITGQLDFEAVTIVGS
jgi:hypothetical protein